MILKKSFLIDMKENLKRRSWVFWISFLVFFCYFPGFLLLSLNSIRSDFKFNVNEELAIQMKTEMRLAVNEIFLINPVMPFLLIGLAVLIGIQGFAYLHNKRQVDFYHSQPVSRKRRFLVLWLNGIVIFVVTYLINMLLGILVTAAFGAMTMAAVLGAFKGFVLYLVFFLGVYHLAMIAVLLTGNILVTFLALGVILGYELAVRGMIMILSNSFFCTSCIDENMFFNSVSSPIMAIYKYITTINSVNSYSYAATLGQLFVFAVVFFGISFFLYKYRKSESHGSSISFAMIKEPVRFLLLVLIGVFGSLLIFYAAGDSIVFALLGGIFFVVLGHILIQIIYEVDFRAVRKNWITSVVSLAAAMILFLAFRYDWMGYDYRIPKQSKVESVYLDLNEGVSQYNSTYILKDGTERYRYTYVKENMRLTDLDTVYELLDNRKLMKVDEFQENVGSFGSLRVDFHLKNGKTQSRVLYLDFQDNLEVLDKIYHMEEFQTITNQVMEENFAADYNLAYATYFNGEREHRLPERRVKELWEAYRKDVQNSAYKEAYYNLPIGRIYFEGHGLKNKDWINTWDVLIYESYTNTLKILQEEGIKIKDTFSDEYLDSIERIEVQYLDRETYNQEGTYVTWSSCNKTVNYENKELFAKILENALSEPHRWWSEGGQVPYQDYTIMIYRKTSDSEDAYGQEVFYQTGDLPAFILEDLEDVEFGETKQIK